MILIVPAGICRRVSPASTARGRRTRERILTTAADLFHRRGVNATSVDDVLAASGTGKSQFYHYFESKDELLHDVATFNLQRLLAEAAFIEELDTWKGIKGWFDWVVAQQKELRCVGG